MIHRVAVVILAFALLAAPSGAVAQSAGDEQYSDPFGPSDQPQQPQEPRSDSPSAPEQPPPEPTPVDPTTAQQPAIEEPAAEPPATLPYSGLPVGIAAGAGVFLLATGALLRRRG